jgi:hypothetical protein
MRLKTPMEVSHLIIDQTVVMERRFGIQILRHPVSLYGLSSGLYPSVARTLDGPHAISPLLARNAIFDTLKHGRPDDDR